MQGLGVKLSPRKLRESLHTEIEIRSKEPLQTSGSVQPPLGDIPISSQPLMHHQAHAANRPNTNILGR